jgi:ABC-2 type transport system permease protein
MRPDVLTKTLRDRRRSTIAWSIGLGAVVFVLCAYWPSVRDSEELQSFARDLPEGLKALIGDADYGSPAGFLSAELFSFLVPALLLVVAIGMGARAVAREEETGTVDLLLSLPITRRRVLVEKVAGGLIVLVVLGVVLFVSLWAGSSAFDMDIAVGRLAQISLASVALVLPFGALALAVSCATGHRGPAAGAASAAAVAAYLLHALAPVVDSLSGWDDLSPFAWYEGDTVLSTGVDAGNIALLFGSAALLVVIAAAALERRDLAT